MAETRLDHPGEVSWFKGYGPKTSLRTPCDHACDHNFTLGVIAWGPDFEHYCLVECDQCGCRGWTAEYPPPFSEERPKHRVKQLVQVSDA